ncbi:DUF2183 multi-domain protein [Pyrenophora tritici-repentis]|uniref:DUF2183 multi-domain protein n=1 Tax=Pyrenophora tritici-repentis TaxID=45151 RepID=A0A834VX36_9PLEO|nr:DUF2183 multi-domain protein [Pyrenophora tritici-repentis]
MSSIPGWFEGLPTGSQVLSSLGINDGDLAAQPTQVLNIPPYANWTDQGWNVRFHGNVYKFPNISQSKVDDLANVFLIDTSVDKLNNSVEQDQARNLTRSIFIVQQSNVNVSMSLEPAPSQGGDGEPGGGNSIQAPGGVQNLTLPYETTDQGDFDVFVPIQSNGLIPRQPDQQCSATERLHQRRVSSTLLPAPFTPWMNMPDIYANWSRSLPNNTSFHYLTTTPEQATRLYMDFIYKTYPGGSFDTRPLNFSDVKATLSIRMYLLTKIFETFPQRKFVLVADTSNSDVMKDYPQLAHTYPNQVQCIFLRNTSATDSGMWFPYNTEGFKGLNNRSYMFFRVPDDLTGLDIANGQCLNETIPQNVTFSRQAEILGIHGSSAGTQLKSGATISFVVALIAAVGLLL